eukprot:7107976-Alexandrium_andersonii.AAC.1
MPSVPTKRAGECAGGGSTGGLTGGRRLERLARGHLGSEGVGQGRARWLRLEGHRPGLPPGSRGGGPAAHGGGLAAA